MKAKMTSFTFVAATVWVLVAVGAMSLSCAVGGPQDSRENGQSQPPKTRSTTNPVTRPSAASKSRAVIINRTLVSEDKLRAIEQQFQFHIPDGDYWYDKVCGAWGKQGGPTQGFALPGLNLGGPLRADASNGHTRVFINGRELHTLDVLALQKLGPVFPGRYWLNAQGDVGFEGGPAFANLLRLSQQASGSQRGGRRRSITSGMYDSSIGRVTGPGFISGSTGATWDK